MTISFYCVDDVKISSESIDFDIDDGLFEIPKNYEKLRALCKAVAILRGHHSASGIVRIEVTNAREKRNSTNLIVEYELDKFCEFFKNGYGENKVTIDLALKNYKESKKWQR